MKNHNPRFIAGCGLLIALLFAAGCVSTKPSTQMIVDNVTGKTVHDVVIKTSDLLPVDFDKVPAKTATKPIKIPEGMGQQIEFQWRDENGKTYAKAFKLENKLKKRFKGRVLFQIEEAGIARMFVTPQTGNPDYDIPWNVPAAWQGTPNIPGLSQ